MKETIECYDTPGQLKAELDLETTDKNELAVFLVDFLLTVLERAYGKEWSESTKPFVMVTEAMKRIVDVQLKGPQDLDEFLSALREWAKER